MAAERPESPPLRTVWYANEHRDVMSMDFYRWPCGSPLYLGRHEGYYENTPTTPVRGIGIEDLDFLREGFPRVDGKS